MPLISVIVPVYKVEPYLSRCIDSILTQTFKDFELILINDGSPDNCGKICDEYAQKDRRIQVIHKENGGLSSARNAGIDWAFENSNSQWLTFIDSDDWIHPQYLELLLHGAISTHTDISVCEYINVGEFSDFESISDSPVQETSPEAFFVNHHITAIIACCKLYKKSCFESIRYPLGKLHEDEYTTYKVLFGKKQISYLETPLYFYFTNPESIMKTNWSPKRLDVIGAIEEQISFFKNNGFDLALKKSEKLHLWYIVSQIEKIEQSGDFKPYAIKLKKELRVLIKCYKKSLNLSIRTATGIYEKAYPLVTKLFLIVVSIYRNLRIKIIKIGNALRTIIKSNKK